MTHLARLYDPLAHTVPWELEAQHSACLETLPAWDLNHIVSELREVRLNWRKTHLRSKDFGGRELPSLITLEQIIKTLLTVLFPMRFGPIDLRQDTEDYYVGLQLDTALHALLLQVRLALSYQQRAQLEDKLYAWGNEVESNAVEVHIHHLRRKLYPSLIETVRGVGYWIPRPKEA